ncbi:hypothetical protein BDV95DRAFT_490873 [Massariosphaeria phaeospora]|uniref:PD-(D/E)XK nuclease-like domain-containing protein n=1 Tax=Massariosphaeria phaeospora TaxID=100035 RepID=A0A7C8IBA9_9PLEO|nr:hypothetical protein BDV95DRAFT_490873 [Massariosphaeria phaeospora]
MIDFVGCLIPQSVPDDTFSAWMREQPHYLRTVNQTSYPPISRTPTVISIEVKLDGDEDEALMQLGVWLSSWHNRVGLLQKNGPVISLPAIIVLRHEWTLYLAVDVGKSIDLVYIADIGNTRSLEGTYRLLAVLRRIGDWSLTTFNPWFKHTFLGLKEE